MLAPSIRSYPVLDQGFVELHEVMGSDATIIQTARVSHASSGDSDADRRLLEYIFTHHHTSPFEAVEFRFRVRAPLLVCWQWFRHRTWSYLVQSGRYTTFSDHDFYVPATFSRDQQRAFITYANQGYSLYTQALEEGIEPEQARLFLPGFGVYYNFFAKVDAHNLMHFLHLRCSDHAQSEIRAYATTIRDEIFAKALPWTAELFNTHGYA